MTPKDLEKATYIGDGVYVGIFLGAVWLVTYDGMRTTNEICLEPLVIEDLLKYFHYIGVVKA